VGICVVVGWEERNHGYRRTFLASFQATRNRQH
jgi:hypothetical protein